MHRHRPIHSINHCFFLQQEKRVDIPITLITAGNALRDNKSGLICNVRFKNDLPQVPCDPKMLIAPLNHQELAAFHLTSLEKEMKRGVLFPPDLGIPINALDIERYSIPSRSSRNNNNNPNNNTVDAMTLHPADAALLQDEGERAEVGGGGAGGGRRGMQAPVHRARRENASDVSWLMRTKYITNDYSAAAGPNRRAVMNAEKKEAEAALVADENNPTAQLAAIEASFQAAHRPPKHPKNVDAVPLEQLPILPDELLEGWSCVQATFDGAPGADVDRLMKLTAEERSRTMHASQLKSFSQKRADGSKDQFVAYLLPSAPPPAAPAAASSGGAVCIAAADLRGDYEWVREYDSQVRYDERNQTYLLRMGTEYVGYSDLNTKVGLRKRKRGSARGGGGGEDNVFLQPEKFILELPEDAEEEEEIEIEAAVDEEEEAALGVENGNANMDVDVVDTIGADDTAVSVGVADVMQAVFGDDDDDDA